MKLSIEFVPYKSYKGVPYSGYCVYVTRNLALQAPSAFIIDATSANSSENSGEISELFDAYYGDHNGFFGLAFGLVSLLGPFGYGIRLNISELIFKFVSCQCKVVNLLTPGSQF